MQRSIFVSSLYSKSRSIIQRAAILKTVAAIEFVAAMLNISISVMSLLLRRIEYSLFIMLTRQRNRVQAASKMHTDGINLDVNFLIREAYVPNLCEVFAVHSLILMSSLFIFGILQTRYFELVPCRAVLCCVTLHCIGIFG